MKAYQVYVSYVMRNFGFPERCQLQPYHNKKEPLVVYGAYRPEDIKVILNHKGIVYLFWCGDDVWRAPLKEMKEKENIIHLTTLPAIASYLKRNKIKPVPVKFPAHQGICPYGNLGDKVYTYLRKGKPKYHGSDIVNSLKIKNKIIVGDQSINRIAWHNGKCEEYYGKAFIGLFLSSFAGGGHGIIEMGLRGIKVVTNVLTLPHCIPWNDTDDIISAILREEEKIGTKRDTKLAQKVYNNLAHPNDCFDLEKEMI
jgi:hypothetical protein